MGLGLLCDVLFPIPLLGFQGYRSNADSEMIIILIFIKLDMSQTDNSLDYLFIINQYNEPLLFKSYRSSSDDLNIQLHSYACLDFLDEKVMEKSSEYLGQVYTILNLSGEYSVYAFYTVTRIKFLAIFRQNSIDKLD